METIQIISSNFNDHAVELIVQTEGGSRKELRIPMADFMLMTRKTQEQVLDQHEGRSPSGQTARPMSVVQPRAFAVLQQFASGNPVLMFDCGGLGQLPLEIPKAHMPRLLQELSQASLPDGPTTTN
ncbi:hypothetical protein ACQUFY_06440 [Robbsia andropogonis]